MLTKGTAEVGSLFKPTRLNFAGMCIYCETFGCTSVRCQATHARSVWGICPDCNGTCLHPEDEFARCSCLYGVTEFPAPAAEAAGSVAPVSVPPALMSVPLPRCLGCGHRTASPHTDCAAPTGTHWSPCPRCVGLRIDADGFECGYCSGVGFIDQAATDTPAERAGDLAPWDLTPQ